MGAKGAADDWLKFDLVSKEKQYHTKFIPMWPFLAAKSEAEDWLWLGIAKQNKMISHTVYSKWAFSGGLLAFLLVWFGFHFKFHCKSCQIK